MLGLSLIKYGDISGMRKMQQIAYHSVKKIRQQFVISDWVAGWVWALKMCVKTVSEV